MIEDVIVPVLSGDSPVSDTELFTYIDSKDYHTIINPDTLPRSLRSGGIFLCLGGEGDVIINGHKYHLTAGTLCFAFKGTIIQALDMNDDFKSYTLAINTDFLRELNIPYTFRNCQYKLYQFFADIATKMNTFFLKNK